MDLVVLSHLRWHFVFQRPQHLMTRAAARGHRVLFVEEPIAGERLDLLTHDPVPNVTVAVPTLPDGTTGEEADRATAKLIRTYVDGWFSHEHLVAWHYSAMSEPLSHGLPADAVVYDCMDELSLFRDAPRELVDRERALMARADVVFTGGYSLWEAKQALHPSVHAFPSSVDVHHFAQARGDVPEPEALREIPRPRLMYAGVIDERLDHGLIGHLADAGIGEVVLVGPIVKIDPADVPAGPHVHQVGMQPYADLPAFFGHADVGIMPFALSDATRYISPTKTPEYLAAGLPVVSTPIRDVVRGYGDLDSVHIGDGPDAFVEAVSRALGTLLPDAEADERLALMSWDRTWEAMDALIAAALRERVPA